MFGDGPPLMRNLVLPDPATPGRVYASVVLDLVVSEDWGDTFRVLRTDLPLSAAFYRFPVGALAHDGERLYATASGADVFRATADDRTWERWADGARSGVVSLAIIPGDPPTLAAASTADGVLLRDVEALP